MLVELVGDMAQQQDLRRAQHAGPVLLHIGRAHRHPCRLGVRIVPRLDPDNRRPPVAVGPALSAHCARPGPLRTKAFRPKASEPRPHYRRADRSQPVATRHGTGRNPPHAPRRAARGLKHPNLGRPRCGQLIRWRGRCREWDAASMGRWYTSDHHFGHQNIIRYCDRPFPDAMDKEMVARWNDVVADSDEVWILGDLVMGGKTQGLAYHVARLKGRKILVPGNHDRCWQGNGDHRWERADYYHIGGIHKIFECHCCGCRGPRPGGYGPVLRSAVTPQDFGLVPVVRPVASSVGPAGAAQPLPLQARRPLRHEIRQMAPPRRRRLAPARPHPREMAPTTPPDQRRRRRLALRPRRRAHHRRPHRKRARGHPQPRLHMTWGRPSP
ncbi:MAG: hypothetical protein F4Y28_02245 [Acidimicrobiia bacterium]|nr:hypothetical protein [Acidimicrobiia bacterium]MYJ31744.1 hypothetical protein [Acidimicrobiia bacterium]